MNVYYAGLQHTYINLSTIIQVYNVYNIGHLYRASKNCKNAETDIYQVCVDSFLDSLSISFAVVNIP